MQTQPALQADWWAGAILRNAKMETGQAGTRRRDDGAIAPQYEVDELPPPYPEGAVMLSASSVPPDESSIPVERDVCMYWLYVHITLTYYMILTRCGLMKSYMGAVDLLKRFLWSACMFTMCPYLCAM